MLVIFYIKLLNVRHTSKSSDAVVRMKHSFSGSGPYRVINVRQSQP